MAYRLGIDVGGTNTDAVILDEDGVPVAKHKTPTTEDVTGGIVNAIAGVVDAVDVLEDIEFAMLGTTHCTNAIVERRELARIGVLRVGAPATMAIRPLISWPSDLVDAVEAVVEIVGGGHEFDGREIAPLDEDAVVAAGESMRTAGVEAVAVSAAFSPVNPDHEEKAGVILGEILGGEVSVTLSHDIGSIGLLERENACALNAAVTKVADTAFAGFASALEQRGIAAHLYITQNDGTLMSVDYAIRHPVLTIASGPANSLRGAAYLSGEEDAAVIDVGGTTTDVGVLKSGFPRESAVAVEIGGVLTNFRMPDLTAIGLGGGSLVDFADRDVQIGPQSVGYRLEQQARVFGGQMLTATDIAVAGGRLVLGDPAEVADLDPDQVARALDAMRGMAERAFDRMKTTAGDIPVVLVGGGSVLLPDGLEGAVKVERPQHFEVANAIGAAIAQVSGEVDRVFSLEGRSRDEILEEARQMARDEAARAGATPESVDIVDLEEIPLAYLPGNATRIRVKAAGVLATGEARAHA